ncbi:MAG: ATP-binding protein [Calditrichota bacterium]|jgi:PAS domain S-box-containing protein
MTSKIKKQKQIFSLLNNRFAGFLEANDSENSIPYEKGDESTDTFDQDLLLNKVYNFYKSIIQNINSGLIAIDLLGQITFINQPAAKMLGYEREELIRKNIYEIFNEDQASQKCLRLLFLPGKKIDDKEVTFRKKNNTAILVGLNVSPIHDENNKFDGIVLLFRDLTEIRELKLQIERMEHLALLGELSAGIAHEIRNPLAGIKASAQILQDGVDDENLQQKIIDRMIREVDKANRLLKEFFKFAKPTKPNLKFHDLELIIEGVYLLLKSKFQNKNIEFSTEYETEIPQIFVDDTQIEQVIINLFLNGIDAMPNGGRLKINTFKKQLHVLENTVSVNNVDGKMDYVILQITDSGAGIEKKNLEKIFNPFFTTKVDGLGLGLSICSRLTQENGGKIDVQTESGNGTTFMLALPAFVHK